jgi:type I restriction enzyme M protein
MDTIEQLERRLWDAADQLRANSNLNSSEYFMPVMGLIFLRHAYNRYLRVKAEIEPTLPKRGGVARPLTKEDFARQNALFLREISRFDYLLNLPGDKDKGQAIIDAMQAIEEDYPSLTGVLPKDYTRFDNTLLGNLLKIFNDEALKNANGDIFGRIYEYFLMEFAILQAQDEGEFFTPVSLVQTIVNVIEPDHGILLDPANGSGGMFVQTGHFLNKAGKQAHEVITFYGQEKSATTIRLAKMNLAVHGLEGHIVEGNTYYEDRHELVGKADYVMANPPFNVNGVDAEKVKGDERLPFGLPGVNKKGEVSNGNYLWISYFYSYLNGSGRAGFVMSSQASSAGGGEKEVRRKIVETGYVDVMIAIRSNFFYTRTVPCELWFFNKQKPAHLHDKVLMLDARAIYRKVTRTIYDFSPEQLNNLTAIVWLYRGQHKRFLQLIQEYLRAVVREAAAIASKLADFEDAFGKFQNRLINFEQVVHSDFLRAADTKENFSRTLAELHEAFTLYKSDRDVLIKVVNGYRDKYGQTVPAENEDQYKARAAFSEAAERIHGIIKQVDMLYKLLTRAGEIAEKEFDARKHEVWDNRLVTRLKKDLDEQRKNAVEQLKQAIYFYRQVEWLQVRFPEAKLRDVEGLVKLVDVKDIKANDWSLTPGRYVGVAPQEVDESFDFEAALRDIHIELEGLNAEATELAAKIAKNFEELGV